MLPSEAPVGFPGFTLVDSEQEWFGFHTVPNWNRAQRVDFIFGRLNDDGKFEIDGRVPVDGYFGEVDANPERLIVRHEDRLLIYDWERLDDPVVVPLGELRPPVEAVNDVFEIDFDGQSDARLNVLANDLVANSHRGVEIVDLIGAPEGAEVHGRFVVIPGRALANVEALRFEYVISDGFTESSAVVEVDVNTIDLEAFERLVRQVVEQAAIDLNIDVDEIDVTSVERFIGEPLPFVPPDDPSNPIDLSPGVLVTMKFPGGSALYGGSLDGRIVQIFASHREFLVSLGLHPIDADGNELRDIVLGDEFFLEFQARDLRDFGEGVFAAFFDLTVPTDQLVLTGELEYGEGFSRVSGFTIEDGEIDELGAVSNRIQGSGLPVQRLLRVGVKAVGTGAVSLKIDQADGVGGATLLRGIDEEISANLVKYLPLELEILAEAPADPLDANGDGNVTAGDALVVVNFLGEHGPMTLQELEQLVGDGSAEGEGLTLQEYEKYSNYDTNQSGDISPIDALVVINGVDENTRAAANSSEGEFVNLISSDEDDQNGLIGSTRLF